MKSLQFGAGHLEPTLSGKKAITIRSFRPAAHSFMAGDIVSGIFADRPTEPLLIEITADTLVMKAGEISDAMAREDGFLDCADLINSMRSYYPDFDATTTVGVIRYKPRPDIDVSSV